MSRRTFCGENRDVLVPATEPVSDAILARLPSRPNLYIGLMRKLHMSAPQVTRIILYVKDIPKVAMFYERHFGLRRLPNASEGWVELANPAGGCTIALHSAVVSQKSGAAMKIVFGVEDVTGFKKAKKREGLKFGAIHRANGIEFANAKDPAGNSIQISNRGLKANS